MLAVYGASQDLHFAFSRVVLTHDGMEHIWEKCVRNFPAVGPLLLFLLLLLLLLLLVPPAPSRQHLSTHMIVLTAGIVGNVCVCTSKSVAPGPPVMSVVTSDPRRRGLTEFITGCAGAGLFLRS